MDDLHRTNTTAPNRQRPLSRRALLSAAGGLAVAAWGAGALRAEPTLYEQEEIGEEAREAFRRMVTLWREELYLELYEEGWASSRGRIDLEDFAQRMVESPWVPEGPIDEKFFRADFRVRTMVYIHARMDFRHKFDPNQRFTKDYAALLMWEAGGWKVDLIRLIRSPYA